MTTTGTGADCLRQGIEYPVPMPGYWRQVLPVHNATKVDPYFETYRIYPCNPADICLGTHQGVCIVCLCSSRAID